MDRFDKVWLIGRKSRLGSAIENIISKTDYHLISTDKDDVDIEKLDEVKKFVDWIKPSIIINCASISDRQYCEDHEVEAYRLHAIGARNLAIASQAYDSYLIYLSTDFVFDGKSNKPYNEFDLTNPTTIYGKSKLAGENFVKNLSTRYTILRSSWLYGKKYLSKIKREAEKTGQVKISKTIVGSPTSSLEAAEKIIEFFENREYGTFHISCNGECTFKEFVEEFLTSINVNAKIIEQDVPSDFEILRPTYSSLDNFMLRLVEIHDMKNWKDGLHRFIRERKIG